MAKKLCGLGTICFLAFSYAWDTRGVFPYLLAAVCLHELGHIAAIYACGDHIRRFRAMPFGFCLELDGLLPYTHDAVIAAGGAVGNLITAFCLAQAAWYFPEKEALHTSAGVNLLLGIFHLLPALPLDGGRVLYALLAHLRSDTAAYLVVRRLSLFIGSILFFLGVYILIKTRYNMSILAISGLILGGTYAQRSGNRPAKGAKTCTLCRRRIRSDQKGSEPDRRADGILFPGRL